MAERGDDWGRSPDPTERLPWLEPAEEYEGGVVVSRSKLVGGLVAAILLVLAVWGVVHWAGNRSRSFGNGDGSTIAAPVGPYKVAPADRGGMAVAGEGDTVYATGAGVDNDGRIDLSALPETPVTRGGQEGVEAGDSAVATAPVPPSAKPAPVPAEAKAAAAPAAPSSPPRTKPAKSLGDAVADVAITTGKPVPKIAAAKPVVAKTVVPASAVAAPAAGGNYSLQLGAFSSSSKADQVWKSLSARFAFLAGMGKSVAPLEREGGTVYRLRATGAGGSAAAQGLCARLKVAGESCVPVAN